MSETVQCYTCQACARILKVYIHLPAPPYCTKCGRVMTVAPAETMAGQLALFSQRPAAKKAPAAGRRKE